MTDFIIPEKPKAAAHGKASEEEFKHLPVKLKKDCEEFLEQEARARRRQYLSIVDATYNRLMSSLAQAFRAKADFVAEVASEKSLVASERRLGNSALDDWAYRNHASWAAVTHVMEALREKGWSPRVAVESTLTNGRANTIILSCEFGY